MSTCFHPHLFDADRFTQRADEIDKADLESTAMVVLDCIVDDVDFDYSLDGTEDTDLISGRHHPDTRDYLGGIVDVVRASLGEDTVGGKILARGSCLHGPLWEVEPAVGYLMPAEIDELVKLLTPIVLTPPGIDADRLLLLRLFAIARAHRRGLLFLAI